MDSTALFHGRAALSTYPFYGAGDTINCFVNFSCSEKTQANAIHLQFPCGRVKRFLKNNTQNKMRVGAKGAFLPFPG